MLRHHRDHNGGVFRTLALMDGCCVGRHQCVELAKPINDGAAVEVCGEFAVFGTNIVDIADVAVLDFLVVIVFDLHHFVAGRERPTEALNFALARGVQSRLQFDV